MPHTQKKTMARRYLVLGSLAGALLAGAAVSVAVVGHASASRGALLALPRGTHMLVPTIYVDAAAVTLTSYSFTFSVYPK